MLVAREVEVTVADSARILGPVSLRVPPGSLVALMGPSGSGKSTLLEVLAGISLPSRGEATWAGTATATAVHLAGYVPQRQSVHDRLTPREALQYAARLRLEAGAPAPRRVDAVLEELDLRQQADTPIRKLSGGESRRAACGLELVGDPPVLLLDEPTSGLDSTLERRLMALFRRLADHGRAVLVATHATNSLALCDRVIVLDRGRIAHAGAPDSALAHLLNGSGAARAPLPAAAPNGHASSPAAAATTPAAAATTPAATVTTLATAATTPAAAATTPAATATTPIPAPATRKLALELAVFASRYVRTLLRSRQTLYLQLAQAPLLGILIAVVFAPRALSPSTGSPVDAIQLTFLLMTAAIWLGMSASSREVVKERGLVEREFDVGARLDAYLLAKALVLFALTAAQVALLCLIALSLQPLYVSATGSLEVFALVLLTAWASVATGLLASCLARSVDQAAGVIPLLLMPQLLLAGALIPLAQMPAPIRALAQIAFARWSYAGIASAANVGGRLASTGAGGALGYGADFFSIAPGTAAVTLGAFIAALLIAALLALTHRPAPRR